MKIRRANPQSDYGAIEAIMAIINPEDGITEERMLLRDAEVENGYFMERYVMVDDDNAVCGYGAIRQFVAERIPDYSGILGVFPEKRGQGIGRALIQHLENRVGEEGGTSLKFSADDEDERSQQFAEDQGYMRHSQLVGSKLIVAEFDTNHFPFIDDIAAKGFRFTSIAAENNDLDLMRRYHTTLSQTVADIPGGNHVQPPFEKFLEEFERGDAHPELYFMALDDDKVAGIAYLVHYPDAQHLYHNMTGILPEYRGQKLAQALKLVEIRYAYENGVEILRTFNDAVNVPILKVNRNLGYQRESGYYEYKKMLV